MILRRVEAKNILKYRHLEISDIPAHGRIAVAGANEAGKTAIGETICLGLFGRTFSVGEDELGKVIRWGEYGGVVGITFVAANDEEYSIVREIDSAGKHDARLYREGESVPIADGVEAVERAVHRIAGFTFRSFIDSFYLAQRELEVPHAKSDTVKALIGVDRLEVVEKSLENEMEGLVNQLHALEVTMDEHRQQIQSMNLDKSHLGRLESTRESVLQQVSDVEAKVSKLRSRALSIEKAAASVIEATDAFGRSSLDTTFAEWQSRKQSVAGCLVDAAKASKSSGVNTEGAPWSNVTSAIKEFSTGLDEYEKVQNLASVYRGRLGYLLDESPEPLAGPERLVAARAELRFVDRRADAMAKLDRALRRRKPAAVVAIVAIQAALLGWGGWLVAYFSPQSSLGSVVKALIGMAPETRLTVLLSVGIGSLLLATAAILIYVTQAKRVRMYKQALEDVEAEAQIARVEIGVLEAAESASVPEALEALRGVNNELLESAVIAFEDGDGSVLIRPDELSHKLDDIQSKSHTAARNLQDAVTRFRHKADRFQSEAESLRERTIELDLEVTAERTRWEEVEALDRILAGLESKRSSLEQEVEVRRMGCELIAGTCRRIYERFHPELRRFIGKILPHLTDNRYEHLEIDDDLGVRVYCNEKNDFVSLAEISNGTHRQLMLCVRLALSQALIASSSKSEQFIFFDEPFVFFDEQRMANAIDVLRRISPEITQVWLAAQQFDEPSVFDLMLDCSVGATEYVVSGNGRATLN